MRYALTCSGVRSVATWTGTFSRPSFCAAFQRVWPTMITPSASTTIGWRKPNSRMRRGHGVDGVVVDAGVARVGLDVRELPQLDLHRSAP